MDESYLGVRPVWGELGGVPDQQRGEVDEVVLAADTLTINNCDIAFNKAHVVQDLLTLMFAGHYLTPHAGVGLGDPHPGHFLETAGGLLLELLDSQVLQHSSSAASTQPIQPIHHLQHQHWLFRHSHAASFHTVSSIHTHCEAPAACSGAGSVLY